MNYHHEHSVFNWEELSITQANGVFKVGTDAILLGAWIPTLITETSSILDVGTGTGILALKMSVAYQDAIIEGIDQDENAVRLAQYNFSLSGEKERLRVRLENIFEYGEHDKNKYDLVVCNPPYFFEQYTDHRSAQVKSKHAAHPASVWMNVLSQRMNDGGHICIVLPFENTFEWIRWANVLNLYIHDRLDIFSFEDDIYPRRTLIHLRDHLIKPRLDRLVIYECENMPSEEYLAFSGIKQGK